MISHVGVMSLGHDTSWDSPPESGQVGSRVECSRNVPGGSVLPGNVASCKIM